MYDFTKILTIDHSQIKELLIQLDEKGVMENILPELVALKGVDIINGKKHKDNYFHTLQVVENTYKITDKPYLRLAAILHDIGKAPCKRFDSKIGWTFHNHEYVGYKMTKKVFERLSLDMDQLLYVECIVREHGKMKGLTDTDEREISDSALRRFDLNIDEFLEDLTLFCKCDITTRFEDKMKRQKDSLENVYQKILDLRKRDKEAEWRSPITGKMIMDEYKIKPSIIVGNIMDRISSAIKSGDVEDNYDSAYKFMLDIKKEYE